MNPTLSGINKDIVQTKRKLADMLTFEVLDEATIQKVIYSRSFEPEARSAARELEYLRELCGIAGALNQYNAKVFADALFETGKRKMQEPKSGNVYWLEIRVSFVDFKSFEYCQRLGAELAAKVSASYPLRAVCNAIIAYKETQQLGSRPLKVRFEMY